jgi:hypothetical protein
LCASVEVVVVVVVTRLPQQQPTFPAVAAAALHVRMFGMMRLILERLSLIQWALAARQVQREQVLTAALVV